MIQEAERLYSEREAQYTSELVRQVEVQLMLGLIDERWADYLTTLEHLKDNIRWQSLGQRDPLVEFKAEAFSAFQGFQESLKQEIIRYLFHSQIQVEATASQPLDGVASHPEAGSALPDSPDREAGPRVDSSNTAQPRPGTPSGPAGPAVPRHPFPPQPNLSLSTGSLPVVSRNALCPCGSGKKYKRCHGTTE